MRRVTSIVVRCCLVFLLINMLSIEKCNAKFKTEKVEKALFVFGDSLFDVGNNIYINGSSAKSLPALHWPYGETYFKHATGRFCDGRVVPDFIDIRLDGVATFAGLPIFSPYLQPHPTPFIKGANFASAGAGVILTDKKYLSINLPTQLSYFKVVVKSLKQELGDSRAKSVLENAVYLFSIGGNDYISYHLLNPNTTESNKRAFVNAVVGNLTNVFKAVYSLGGRKIAYQNTGPLGCTPESRIVSSGTCDQDLMEMAREHNNAFSEVLKRLESELQGFRYSIFDYYNALYDRVNNPKKYEFKDGKIPCCGNGPFRRTGCGESTKFEVCSNVSKHVWFDGEHPIERVNLQMATLLWSGAPNVTGPYNMKQFFEY